MFKIITGPMFAGKTTSLIKHINALKPGSFLVFKPSVDTRFDKSSYVTHDGVKVPAQIVDTKQPNLASYLTPEIKTVIIDELNFFTYDDLKPSVEELLELGIDVIGAGLSYDFKKQPFGSTLPLTALSDAVEELFARCDSCQAPANHSYRKVNVDQQFMLGAAESYGACCEECWIKFNQV